MIIKVCGLKENQNIIDICSLDVDWIGYNFYKPSTRYISIVPTVNNEIHQKKVGVFVNEELDNVKEYIDKYNLDLIQLHGDENAEYCVDVRELKPIIKVFRVSDNFNFDVLKNFEMADYFLFDTDSKSFGGSGVKFDWQKLKNLTIEKPFLLSGGISYDDRFEIKNLKIRNFIGIDINSKFETEPGLKDATLISKFVNQLREFQKEDENSPLGVWGKNKVEIAAHNPQSQKEQSKLNEDIISPLGVGDNNEIANHNPQSLKGRSALYEDEISPLGVGGNNEIAAHNPQSQKGQSKLNEEIISPFGVVDSNEIAAHNPQSLKGRPALKEDSLDGKDAAETIDQNFDMFYGATPNIFEIARTLRRNMTNEETIIWNYLKTKPLGFKFRRQHPINSFIADFYCHSLKLVIEIDGINHSNNIESDLFRNMILESFGVTIVRFTNNEINSDKNTIIEKINNILKEQIYDR